jgi:hypothetical protein
MGVLELPEYLGFIQYDMEFKNRNNAYEIISVIDCVEKMITEDTLTPQTIISFQPWNFNDVYDQHYILDPKRPELIKDPHFENCMDTIIREYNFIMKRNLRKSDIIHKEISLCGSFFIHRNLFLKMMDFLSVIVEQKRLDAYDKAERVQGVMAERYLAIFLFDVI